MRGWPLSSLVLVGILRRGVVMVKVALQASRMRISKTEFISCPSCGRTLFDLRGGSSLEVSLGGMDMFDCPMIFSEVQALGWGGGSQVLS